MNRRKFFKSELTVSCESNSRRKNIVSILISIIVLISISSMIVAAIFVINPEIASLSIKAPIAKEAITLEEAMLNELGPNNFVSQWLQSDLGQSDELLYEDSKNLVIMTMPSNDHHVKLSSSNNNHKTPLTTDHQHHQTLKSFKPNIITLISNTSLLSSIEYQGYKISPSKRYLLLWTTKRKQFRHSFTAKYFIYDIKQDLISLLSTRIEEEQSTSDIPSHVPKSSYSSNFEHLDSSTEYLNGGSFGDQYNRFQFVDWFSVSFSNQSNQRDSLILIQNNDIYLLPDVQADDPSGQTSDKAPRSTPIRLTFTGEQEGIFNGIPDWLYEEEILADVSACQLSPKGNTLAYMSFNDTLVDQVPFTVYGDADQVIPRTQRIRYPKAGRVNPSVSIHLIDQLEVEANRNDIQLELPDDLGHRQHYIMRMGWLGNDRISITWMNRNQNESFIIICSRQDSWKCEKNVQLSSSGGWLDLSDELLALDDQHYLALLPKHEGLDVGSFKHIAKVSLSQKDSYTFLTKGRKEIININGFDRERSILYYVATVEFEPGQRQVYALDLITKQESCLSCDLHRPGECLYNSARFSISGKYYILDCDGPGVPRTELRMIKYKRQSKHKTSSLTKQDTSGIAEYSSDTLIYPATKQSSLGGDSSIYSADMAISGNKPLAGDNLPDPSINVTHNKASLSSEDDSILEESNGASGDDSLLWIIEDNQALRDKLSNLKAMPLTMRLRVPIADTNYSANVILLLPPQLGVNSQPIADRRSGNRLTTISNSNDRLRVKRGAKVSTSKQQSRPDQELYSHLTPDTISDYSNQLTSGQQYPMVVDVYAGPNSQKVDYRFHINFGHYLASNQRTIYAMIDGRGSGFQGTKLLYELYHKFGTVEIEDQIEVAAHLTKSFSFIDPSRVAIWGWSYGGYAAAMALAQSNAKALKRIKSNLRQLQNLNTSFINNADNRYQTISVGASMNGVFECAASVAPVTSWIYYDTAYTERYMSSPYRNNLYDLKSPGDHKSSKSTTDIEQRVVQSHNRWLSLNDMRSNINATTSQVSPLSNLIKNNYNIKQAKMSTFDIDLNEHYRRASLIDQIDNIDRKRFLLIHGTADDNVHFQQSIFLMKKLIQKNIMFETRIYPDQDHAIANRADKLHLGSTLSSFFSECFDMAY